MKNIIALVVFFSTFFSKAAFSSEENTTQKYIGLLHSRVNSNWEQPEGNVYKCVIELMLNSDGTIESIDCSLCSTNPAWQKSALLAISRSVPFALPRTRNGYEKFKRINIVFYPQNE